tara:strand:+ start:293 stop:532 length:240 start_codon:yes stop_codon:yes gene_type:complete
MPMINRCPSNGDDERWDTFCEEALNNLTHKDHREFLQIFKEMNPEFCEDKDDRTIFYSGWYQDHVVDMILEEYEDLTND